MQMLVLVGLLVAAGPASGGGPPVIPPASWGGPPAIATLLDEAGDPGSPDGPGPTAPELLL